MLNSNLLGGLHLYPLLTIPTVATLEQVGW